MTQPIFNKGSEIYNITYSSGSGKDARTYRFQIGQRLRELNACIYEIKQEHIRGLNDSFFLEKYVIYIYSYTTNEIMNYRQTSGYDELSFNINYMLSEDD